MKQTVYVETTIASYLAAFPSRDIILAAHRQITTEWWDRRAASSYSFRRLSWKRPAEAMPLRLNIEWHY